MSHYTAVVTALEALAPLRLAAEWDNVGLLVEPPRPRPTRRVLLTIDLTEQVLAEAQSRDVDFIVAYHPVIFSGFKRLDASNALSRVVLRCVADGVPVYSPHTALDAAPDGMSDWLLRGLGPMTFARAIAPATWFEDVNSPSAGAGRLGELAQPEPLTVLASRVKSWLNLASVRIAAPEEHAAGLPLREVAVCPGAGGSLFDGLTDVHLLVTGEMRHHDVLAWVAKGTSVILTEHSNSERGYLGVFAGRLAARLDGVEVIVSTRDRDPLRAY